MPKNNSEFYPGKKQKKRRPAFIISLVVLTLLALMLLLFYGLQKYIVITNDGLHLDIPMLSDGKSHIVINDEGESVKVYDPVDIELVVGEADYENVAATAGKDLETEVKADYISAGYATADNIRNTAAAMQYGNALVIEVKPASGMLVYNSQVDFALAYGTSGSLDLASVVSELKGGEKEIYLVAEICCLNDSTVPDRYPGVSLKTSDGENYTDGSGGWIDPYSAEYRKYIVDLCKELSDMGFDEICLNGLRHPVSEGTTFLYPGTSNANATPITACSGFALSITRSLKNLDANVSVRLNSETAFGSGEDAAMGQNAELFFKIFDRVYYYVDVAAAAEALESAENYVELGDVNLRFVPVCYGATPETACWVFMQG
ncbi:MAG: putative glycoside hydrolase [Bacillota bacterium]|nr:putative glycoside hydrolase [Bacillota bacterium]